MHVSLFFVSCGKKIPHIEFCITSARNGFQTAFKLNDSLRILLFFHIACTLCQKTFGFYVFAFLCNFKLFNRPVRVSQLAQNKTEKIVSLEVWRIKLNRFHESIFGIFIVACAVKTLTVIIERIWMFCIKLGSFSKIRSGFIYHSWIIEQNSKLIIILKVIRIKLSKHQIFIFCIIDFFLIFENTSQFWTYFFFAYLIIRCCVL